MHERHLLPLILIRIVTLHGIEIGTSSIVSVAAPNRVEQVVDRLSHLHKKKNSTLHAHVCKALSGWLEMHVVFDTQALLITKEANKIIYRMRRANVTQFMRLRLDNKPNRNAVMVYG